MDHLQAIRIFARVVETGNFSRAAASLQLPSSTVSKWVATLETQLGVKLLERSTRTVSVTLAGAAYYDRTRQLLIDLDDIESTLGRIDASPAGVLRVDCNGSTARALLMPALPDFCARYPDIQLRVTVTDRTSDLLAENIDCAIRSTADDPGLISRPIGASRWITCASPAYLAQYGTPSTPRQIADDQMPVVSYFSSTSGLVHPLAFTKGYERLNLEHVHAPVLVNESNAHVAAAVAGLGIIQTAHFIVRPHLDNNELVPVLTDWERPPLSIYVTYLPSRRDSSKVKVFTEWASALLSA
jgi:DNA-binding transcriptional LysR family regulator